MLLRRHEVDTPVNARPRLLCLMQLPPPVHGASVINDGIARSAWLRTRFDLEILPLQFATSIQDIERVSLRKLVRAATTAARLASALWRRRPGAVYLTLAPRGPAFYRDCAYVAIAKAFGIERIYFM